MSAWPTVPFGRLARSMRNGLSPSRNGAVQGEVLTLSAVTQGGFDPSHRKDATFGSVPGDDQVTRPGMFLMCRGNGNIGLVGAGVVVPNDAPEVVYPDTVIGAVLDLDAVDPGFLAYAWSTPIARGQIEAGARTTNGTHKVNQQLLESIEIPLPPLPEQRRIAAILDEADALRRKRREALGLLDELLRSAFLEMFGDPVTNPRGWETVVLGEVLRDIETGWSPVCEGREANPGEWGVLKLGAVTTGRFIEEHKALLPDVEPRPDLEVCSGDVLFTRKNTADLVAAVAFVHGVRERLMFPDLVFRLRPDTTRLNAAFLATLLMMPGMRADVQSRAAGSSGSMPGISKAKLVEVVVPLPPLRAQERFHAWLISHEEQRRRVATAIAAHDGLFDALLHRAFTDGAESADAT